MIRATDSHLMIRMPKWDSSESTSRGGSHVSYSADASTSPIPQPSIPAHYTPQLSSQHRDSFSASGIVMEQLAGDGKRASRSRIASTVLLQASEVIVVVVLSSFWRVQIPRCLR